MERFTGLTRGKERNGCKVLRANQELMQYVRCWLLNRALRGAGTGAVLLSSKLKASLPLSKVPNPHNAQIGPWDELASHPEVYLAMPCTHAAQIGSSYLP